MTSKTRGKGGSQRTEWVVGSVSLLLLIVGGGLALYAQQAAGQASAATILLSLYLASWSYVVGSVGLILLTLWWLVWWPREQGEPATMSRHSPAKPRTRRPGSQSFQQPMALVAPSRSSRESDDRNKATSPSKVA